MKRPLATLGGTQRPKAALLATIAVAALALGYFIMNRFVLPTVLRFGRVRVMIYTNDHRPAHVHVWEG